MKKKIFILVSIIFVIGLYFLFRTTISSPQSDKSNNKTTKKVSHTTLKKDYSSAKYIETTKNNVPLYVLRNGKYTSIATINQNQKLAVYKNYDSKWWQLKFDNAIVFVNKNDAKPTSYTQSNNQVANKNLVTKSFIPLKNTPIYLSNNGSSNSFAQLLSNERYPMYIVDNNWLETDIGGKTGFVKRSDVKLDKGIPVLCYHHFLEDKENKIYRGSSTILTPENFNQQMNYLSQQGFSTISTADLEEYINGNSILPSKSVLITLDDGLQSAYKYAFPILKKYNFNATEFIITSRIVDNPYPWYPNKIEALSKPEMQKMKDVFEYQSHTHHLHDLDQHRKSAVIAKPYNEVKSDINESKNILNAHSFAYPFGQFNKQTLDILKELGFKSAFTTIDGYAHIGENPLLINRFEITPKITFDKFKNIVN